MIDAEAAALVAEMDREAEAEKERILAEAREKARQLKAQSEERIAAAREEALRLVDKQARLDEDRLLGEARLEAQEQRLLGMRQVYQRAFELARERIRDLADSPRYAEALQKLVAEALEKLPGPVQLTVSAPDADACRRILRELGRTAEVKGVEAPPGTVIALAGMVKVDNSLRVRLASAEITLETRVTRCLNE